VPTYHVVLEKRPLNGCGVWCGVVSALTVFIVWQEEHLGLGLPPQVVKKQDASQHHIFCPSTGDTCKTSVLGVGAGEGHHLVHCGSGGVTPPPRKILNFGCKLRLYSALPARKLTPAWGKTNGTTGILARIMMGSRDIWARKCDVPVRMGRVATLLGCNSSCPSYFKWLYLRGRALH